MVGGREDTLDEPDELGGTEVADSPVAADVTETCDDAPIVAVPTVPEVPRSANAVTSPATTSAATAARTTAVRRRLDDRSEPLGEKHPFGFVVIRSAGKQDVGGLDISVQQVVPMRVVQGSSDLC